MREEVAAVDAAEWIGNLPINRRLVLLYGICTFGLILDAVDIQIMALLAPAIGKSWGLTTGLSTALFALTASGMFLGAAAAGHLADRFGRKPMLLYSLAFFSLATLACALSASPTYLLAGRFITGIGLGAFISVNIAYLVEFLPMRSRGPLMGLWTVGLPLGNLMATGIVATSLEEWGWRTILTFCAVAAVPLLIGLMCLPESPVYLARKGKTADAWKSAHWLSGTAPPQFHPPAFEMEQAKLSTLFIGTRGRQTALLWSIWFTWNIAYFGSVLWMPTIVSTALPQLSPVLALATLATAGIVGRLAAASMLNRLGRRFTLLLCGAGAIVAAMTLGLSQAPSTWLIAIVALGFFQDGGASALVTWTPELHPTSLRATGVGFANAAGRAGAIASPLILGMLIAESARTAFFLFAAVFLLAIGATILLRNETKGQQLDSGDI